MKPVSSANRLIHAKSLYLQQHAYNPVDWYPWGEEAFQTAREHNKPILLSIGYSACHWCHVMAHESFEDIETAELMNKGFINIKVDREERPDIDQVYQTSFQLLFQRGGGWPLTLFLHPDDKIPFFGGTYFPPIRHYGLPGFKEILISVAHFYQKNQAELLQQNHQLQQALTHLENPTANNTQISFDETVFVQAAQMLEQEYDEKYGGFGRAPKFPSPHFLRFIWEQYHALSPLVAEEMILKDIFIQTLDKMSAGGIVDHIGGGFFRYSVDERWEIPHFEKMLYDNGQLLALYVMAQKKDVSRMIADWVLREMQDPNGGYYATLDADSEGQEGKYYCWERSEVEKILTPEEFSVMCQYFNFNQPPNFEGQWHLYQLLPIAENDLIVYQKARLTMLKHRIKRVPPACNQQLIVAWNGLMMTGMALAGEYLEDVELICSAQRAVDRIAHQKFDFLDDYAFLLVALIQLLQLNWRVQDLHLAIKLADTLCVEFMDNTAGGFFFTSHQHEKLIQRPKPLIDNVIPSGNGMAALGLYQLGYLLGEPRYLIAAENTLKYAWTAIQQQPHLHTTLLSALREYFMPPSIVILRGNPETLVDWKMSLKNLETAQQLIFIIPAESQNLPEALAEKKWTGYDCAYVCEGQNCKARVDSLAALLSLYPEV